MSTYMGVSLIFFFYGLLGLFTGAVLGSFSAAFVYRQAHQISIFKDKNKKFSRSKCASCKHVLALKDLVPVLSWINLRGKCRYCQARISSLYPIIEAASMFYAVFILFAWDISLLSLIYLASMPLCWVLIINGARNATYSLGVIACFVLLALVYAVLKSLLISTVLWAFGLSLCVALLLKVFTRCWALKESVFFAAFIVMTGATLLPLALLILALFILGMRKVRPDVLLEGCFISATASSFIFITLVQGVMNIYDLLSSIY